MALYKYARSSFTGVKYQRLIIILVGAALAATMMVGCNQATVAGGGSYPADATSPGDELGVVVDKDMKVLDVEPGSAAEKAGVQVGDVLDTVEGVSVGKDKDKVKNLIREPKKDKKLKLKLKRADKDMEVDISPAPPVPRPGAATPTPVFAPQDYF
jgi:predicted metalloprotease with PDZ domain